MTKLNFSSALVLAGLLAVNLANGQGVESFLTGADPSSGEYSLSTLAGQSPTVSGWTGSWSGDSNHSVVGSSLAYPGLPTAGGSIQSPGDSGGRVGRALSSPTDGSTNATLFMSFLMDATGASEAVEFESFGNTEIGSTFANLELHKDSIGDANRQIQIGVGENIDGDPNTSGNYSVRILNDNLIAADLGPNDQAVNHFLVRFDLSSAANSDSVTVYRNPENLANEAGSTIDFAASGLDLELEFTTFARFDVFSVDSGADIGFDELRFASTYRGATGVVPEPTSIALLACGVLGLLGCRRK